MRALNYRQIARVYLEVLVNKEQVYVDKYGVYFIFDDYTFYGDKPKKCRYIPGTDGGLYGDIEDNWDGYIEE